MSWHTKARHNLGNISLNTLCNFFAFDVHEALDLLINFAVTIVDVPSSHSRRIKPPSECKPSSSQSPASCSLPSMASKLPV